MKHTFYIVMGLLLIATACKKDQQGSGKLPLQVKRFWPNSGNAGTIVHIAGSGFGAVAADNEVLFNGTAARVVDVQDSILIVQAPANAISGTVSITAGGQKADAGVYTYQALSLHGISPANGSAGTNITISGAGFTSLSGPAKVFVNGKEALVSNAADTMLVAIVPQAAGSGKIKVVVDGKEVEGPDFNFQHISGIKPARGGKGTRVAINGEGFSTNATDNQVSFNGIPAVVISAAGNQLIVEVPDKVVTGPVSLTINGQPTIGDVFTVIPSPVLTTVAPVSGPAGTLITITGENFSNLVDEITITFNGKPAVIASATEKKITVNVPVGAGTGPVKVTVNNQETQGPEFKEQLLGVAALLPDNGLAGQQVTIQGVGFSTVAADNQVSFNGVAAVVSDATTTTLQVTVPVGATTGVVTVATNGLQAIGPVFKRAGVATLAGGPASSVFNWIYGLAADKQGNVYATDGNMVKKIAADGTISVLAGQQAAGSADGTGAAAQFNFPTSLAMDASDNLYVVDKFNRKIRKVSASGVVSTFATLPFSPDGLAVDKNGIVYVGADYQGVYQVAANGIATRLTTQAYETANFLCAPGNGTVYYAADYSYNGIFQITGGVKSMYAGASNEYGSNDGALTTARFGQPVGLVMNEAGTMYTTDRSTIRMIADGIVTTFSGTQGGTQPVTGYADGAFDKAKFSEPTAMCIDKDGNVYIAERFNRSIRKLFFK